MVTTENTKFTLMVTMEPNQPTWMEQKEILHPKLLDVEGYFRYGGHSRR